MPKCIVGRIKIEPSKPVFSSEIADVGAPLIVDRKFNYSDLIRREVLEVGIALSSYKLRGLFRTARLYRYRWSISMAGSR